MTLHEPNRTSAAGAVVALALVMFLAAAPAARAEDKTPTSQPTVTDEIPGSTVSIEMVSIPAGEFNWTQYSPTGELAQLVWEGQTLVYRTRAANDWHEEAIATAPGYTQADYSTRDQVQRASQSAQLVFTADGTPHVLFLESDWISSANGLVARASAAPTKNV